MRTTWSSRKRLIEYVASLNDAHDLIAFPTTFSASLPMSVDIYDGKVLIEALNPAVIPRRPARRRAGVDRRPAGPVAHRGLQEVCDRGEPAQHRSRGCQPYRQPQPADHAAHLRSWRHGDRRDQAGSHRRRRTSYVVPWSKIGIPVISQGPVPSPRRGNGRLRFEPEAQALASAPAGRERRQASSSSRTVAPPTIRCRPTWSRSARCSTPACPRTTTRCRDFGSRFPVYGPPPGFVLRPVPPGHAGVPAQRNLCVERRPDRPAADPVDVAAQRRAGPAAPRSGDRLLQ